VDSYFVWRRGSCGYRSYPRDDDPAKLLLELLSTPLGVVINSAAVVNVPEESPMDAEKLAGNRALLAKEAQTQVEELRVSNEELTEQTYAEETEGKLENSKWGIESS